MITNVFCGNNYCIKCLIECVEIRTGKQRKKIRRNKYIIVNEDIRENKGSQVNQAKSMHALLCVCLCLWRLCLCSLKFAFVKNASKVWSVHLLSMTLKRLLQVAYERLKLLKKLPLKLLTTLALNATCSETLPLICSSLWVAFALSVQHRDIASATNSKSRSSALTFNQATQHLILMIELTLLRKSQHYWKVNALKKLTLWWRLSCIKILKVQEQNFNSCTLLVTCVWRKNSRRSIFKANLD